jgi:hypothetical protein
VQEVGPTGQGFVRRVVYEQVLEPGLHLPVGGPVQGDVKQDVAVPVGVVRGQDVDGQARAQLAPHRVRGAIGMGCAADRQKPGAVSVRGQERSAARVPALTASSRPGQRDLDGVVERHRRTACRTP